MIFQFLFFLEQWDLESDKDIIANITYNLDDIKMINILRKSIEFAVDENGVEIKTKEQAVEYLITKLRRNKRISQTDEEIAKQFKRKCILIKY